MRVTRQTIDTLKAQGIEIKIYPHETYEEWAKECWEKEYQYSYDYEKNGEFLIDGKIRKMTHEELDERAKRFADHYGPRKANGWYDAQVLYIKYGDRQIARKETTKSKEITVEYIQKVVERDKKAFSGAYGDFARKMEQLLQRNGIGRNFCIYPTTYGIGVWLVYNFSADADIKRVDSILNEQGIEFRNEYSDAQWVWRYVISKAEANRLRIDKAA